MIKKCSFPCCSCPWWKKVICVVVLLMVVVGLIFAGMRLQEKKQISNNSSKIIPTQSISTAIPTADPTIGWKTYTNKDYGFEFKYPANFNTTEGLNQNFLNETPLIELESKLNNYQTNQINSYFNVSIKNNGKTECEYIPRGVLNTKYSKAISGVNFIAFSTEGVATGNTYLNNIYHYFKNSTCYEIVTTIHRASDGNSPESLPKINEQQAILQRQLDQILSTFKFTDQTSVDETKDWKTYTNETYKYKFSYPGGWWVKTSDKLVQLFNYDIDKAPGRSYDPKTDGNLFKIEISVDENNSGVKEWFEKHKKEVDPMTDKPYQFFNIKEITVSSASGIYYEVKDSLTDLTLGSAVFQTPQKSLIHFYGGLNFEANKTVFDQILSTFKFTQ